jgi:glycosyltransferase involved in cell wall biosynthesis
MRNEGIAIIAGGIRSQEAHLGMLAQAKFDMTSGRAIFTDFISRDELKALYQSADIFAFPSRADTLPLVVLEAMVSRLPVVSTKVGGIPYEVTGETGILVNPGDSAALADALDILCENPARRAAMGAAGRARAIEIFNWDRSAETAVATYERVTGLSR